MSKCGVKCAVLFFAICISCLVAPIVNAEPVDLGTLSVVSDNDLQIRLGRLSFNRRTGEQTTTITLTNQSADVIENLAWLALENISSDAVNAINNDEESTTGIPVYDLGLSSLASGESQAVVVKFSNPTRLRFNYTPVAYQQTGSGSDTTPPVLSITSPLDGGLVTDSRRQIQLDFSDESGVDPDSIEFAVNTANFNADCTVDASQAQCTPLQDYPEGNVILAAFVSDLAGNQGSEQIQFTVDTQPLEISINTPQNRIITKEAEILVEGTVNSNVSVVKVNDVLAQLDSQTFSATVPLREGTNMVVAVASAVSGKTATDSIDVTRDIQAPIVRIQSPNNGFVTANSTIAVTGLVNDIVNGATNARVLVNDIEATVTNGAFMALDIPLIRGPNTITATATDQVGNQGSHSVIVTLQQSAGGRLSVFSGNGQSQIVNQQLDQPLVVELKDQLGNPIAGRLVTFKVDRNSGMLATGSTTFNRTVQVPTDGSGQATAIYQLGDTTGEGNNRVLVSALGVAGQVEFCASALPAPADKILMVNGDNQRGTTGNPLPNPLEALVVDQDGNPIPDITVTFSVVQGGGNLDSETSRSVTTGTDGLARVIFTLGQEPGINNNVVTASYPGLIGAAATFVASALAPGKPEDTRFSGVVLDSGHTAIPGAVVSIPNSTATTTTDEEGQFLLENVPVGHIELAIDPVNSPRPEKFPELLFETTTVAGQNNILGQPIILPAINSETKTVGGNQDVTLTMPGVEGLSLTVFANSVTFPDGSNTGLLSISQVHLDKVPMPPPNGIIFIPPAWTIQPAGTDFDPPARITIPNNGLAPGRVIDIFTFDHALNEFVSVGKGTVSEDGRVITSDPGFGIVHAGWGGGGPPVPPPTCTRKCSNLTPDECSEIEDADCPACPFKKLKPSNTPLSKQSSPSDCVTDTCGGSIPNDSEIPEPDAVGNCQSLICKNGVPSAEADESDITPEDAKCKKCEELNLTADESKNENKCGDGSPEQECLECKDGECTLPDCDASTAKTTLTLASNDLASDYIRKITRAVTSAFPILNVEVKPSINGDVALGEECCKDCSKPVKKADYTELSGTAGIIAEANIGPSIPEIGYERSIAKFGYVLEVEIDVKAEVTIGLQGIVSGTASGRYNLTCEQGCIQVKGGATISPRGFAGAEINEFDVELKKNGSDREFDIIEIEDLEISTELILGSVGIEAGIGRGNSCDVIGCNYTVGEGKFKATASGGSVVIFNFNFFRIEGIEFEYKLWDGFAGSCG